MSLSDKLKELQESKLRQDDFCAYKSMYENLTPENRKALDDAWAKGLSANIVLSALRAEGIKSSNEAIRLHKKGLCKCVKK